MRHDKKEAIRLRRMGKSYREIQRALKIPPSTLSDWFSKTNWSHKIKARLIKAAATRSIARMMVLNKTRGERLARAYDLAREEAVKELGKLKYNPVFIAGIMLYWGEGDKNTKHLVRLVNTDPGLIRFYVFFLTHVCAVPMSRIRASIFYYPDLNEKDCRVFWSKNSSIPSYNFTKSILISGRHKTKRLPFGICTVTISSTYLKVKFMTWIKFLGRELMNKRYYASI